MSDDLTGRVCLVTGGAMGLGRADADLLAKAGASVVITDTNEAEGRRTADELGPNLSFMRHDVTREAEWVEIIAEVTRRFGRLDVLVNNAGIVEATNVEETEEVSWRRVNAVSADGTFFGCKHAIRAMRANRSDGAQSRSIINMSSVAALRGQAGNVAYAAAKGAVLSMTRSVAAHCIEQRLDIRCNCLAPGAFDTPMFRAAVGEAAEKLELGSAYDIAEAVLYLASPRSRFVNGAEIVIDNGMIMKSPALTLKSSLQTRAETGR